MRRLTWATIVVAMAGIWANSHATYGQEQPAKVVLLADGENAKVLEISEVDTVLVEKARGDAAPGDRVPGQPQEDYWIGVKLHREPGVSVIDILPDSPAAKAGLKKGDVILSAGNAKLGSVHDLMEAVKAAGAADLKLTVLRGGEQQEIVVKPSLRAQMSEDGTLNLTTSPVGVRIVRPGYVLSGGGYVLPGGLLSGGLGAAGRSHDLPPGMTLKVIKEGTDKAQFQIKQGEQTWTITEDKIAELPAEVRQHVMPFLGADSQALSVTSVTMPTQLQGAVTNGPQTDAAANEPGDAAKQHATVAALEQSMTSARLASTNSAVYLMQAQRIQAQGKLQEAQGLCQTAMREGQAALAKAEEEVAAVRLKTSSLESTLRTSTEPTSQHVKDFFASEETLKRLEAALESQRKAIGARLSKLANAAELAAAELKRSPDPAAMQRTMEERQRLMDLLNAAQKRGKSDVIARHPELAGAAKSAPATEPAKPADSKHIDERFDMLQRQLDEVRKSIESLNAQRSATPAYKAPEKPDAAPQP